ncbi:MAG: response regulator [Cellvibrionaceae bacterium]
MNTPTFTQKNILLIEDNEADQLLFKEVAQQILPDAIITCADDGQEAIELLEHTMPQPDIIFLDINMPVMNGYEFLQAYGQVIEERDIPTYILTSSQNERDTRLFSPYTYIRGHIVKSTNYENIFSVLKAL